MPVSALAVAAELRRRLPTAGTTQIHKLLYYCQGHHLADLSRPLFHEAVVAWDKGPVVGALWQLEKQGAGPDVEETLDEGALNTVGYVVSRYGQLSARDLIILTHGEAPWREADARRRTGGSVPIPLESLQRFFASSEDGDEPALDDAAVARLVAGAEERRREPATVDSLEEIERRIRALSG